MRKGAGGVRRAAPENQRGVGQIEFPDQKRPRMVIQPRRRDLFTFPRQGETFGIVIGTVSLDADRGCIVLERS